MRFHGLDLNLLVALDVLLAERNTIRAGEKLHLSQSAASSALVRLREHFKDDLLVQVGRSLVPTPRAIELQPVIRSLLMQIEGKVLTKADFEPATSHRKFKIMASDYVSMVALRHGLIAIGRMAPQIQFEIQPVNATPSETIERGEVDLLIMPDLYISGSQPSRLLFEDSYVCIAAAENPEIGDSLSFENYLALPHVTVRFSNGRQPAFEDWFVGRFGHSRTIDVVTSNHATLPYFVAGTRRIATLHARHGQLAAKNLPLKVLDVPTEIPPIKEVVQWNAINGGDDALMWVVDMLIAHQ